MVYDVKQSNRVLITLVNEGDAKDMVELLNDGYGEFQGPEDAWVVEPTERDGKPAPAKGEEKQWAMSVGEVQELLEGEDNEDVVRSIWATETRNPKYDGGRKGVLDAAEERLGELVAEE